jgi:parallel beta-helix repeat protein
VTLLGASGIGESRADNSGISELKSTSSFAGNMIENSNPSGSNSNIQIRNLRIFGPFGGSGRSISFRAGGGQAVSHARIENCQIWSGGVEWLVVHTSWLVNNFVGGQGGLRNPALDLQGSDNIITGNQITTDPVNPTQPGIRARWSTGCVISNNIIFFCTNNIVLEDTHRGMVVGNRIDSAWLDGIVVRSSVGGGTMSQTITGNSFFNNGRNPALPQGAGIRLEGTSHHVVISGNVFGHEPTILPPGSDRQKYGVALVDGVHHNVVVGNTFENQMTGSIYTAPGVPSNQQIGLNAA